MSTAGRRGGQCIFCTFRLSEIFVAGNGRHGGARSLSSSVQRNKDTQKIKPRVRAIHPHTSEVATLIISSTYRLLILTAATLSRPKGRSERHTQTRELDRNWKISIPGSWTASAGSGRWPRAKPMAQDR